MFQGVYMLGTWRGGGNQDNDMPGGTPKEDTALSKGGAVIKRRKGSKTQRLEK